MNLQEPQNGDLPLRDRPSLIDVERVSVAVGGARLLAPISLQADAGQIVALRGENGAGKTTLLRVLAGRTRATTGTVRIGGSVVDERHPIFRRRVAVMIGLPPMAADLTVFDHVALVSSTWEQDAESVRVATGRTLAEFGLTALGTRFPHELSSGQTQLFGLALVFVRPFDVLLLDEPEQRLDADRVELVAQAMRNRCECGSTIVLATHSAILAEGTANRTLLLESAS